MTSTITRDAEGTVTGNTFDKYGSTNPVVQKLMAGFERTLDELLAKAAPRSVLDVGCGEGVLTQRGRSACATAGSSGSTSRTLHPGRVGQADRRRTSSTGS